MDRGPIVISVSFALLASIALAPTASSLERFHGKAVGGRVIAGGHPSVSHRFVPRPFSPHPFFPRHFFRPFVPFGVIAPAVVVYAPPPVFYGSPAYYGQSGYYDPPAVYNPPPAVYSPPMASTVPVAPAPPPTPNVVEYPTGRYELRGDGVTTPYTWVWIPNPPPPPPPAAPPAGGPASDDPSPAPHRELYRWTDEQGVLHLTDSWDAVPKQHRAQPKQPS